jgi:hypothetical protein
MFMKTARELAKKVGVEIKHLYLTCRFRKLHPIDSPVMANQNKITG